MEREAVRIGVPFDALDLGTASEFLRWVLARVDADAPPEVDAELEAGALVERSNQFDSAIANLFRYA